MNFASVAGYAADFLKVAAEVASAEEMDFWLASLYNSISFLSFAIEIVVGEIIFGAKLRRRNKFALRAVPCIAALALLVYPFGLFHMWLSNYPMAVTVVYFLYFCITLGALKICFDERWQTLIFCGVAAYVLQNLSYRIMSILETVFIICRVYEGMDSVLYNVLQNALYYSIYALTALAVYFLFAKRMNKMESARLQSASVLIVSALMLTVTIVLCSWTNLYQFLQWWDTRWCAYLLIINYIFSVLCCVFILYIQSGMLSFAGIKNDLEMVEKLWEQDKRQYEISKENIEIINIKCHDLKHKIKTLRLGDGEISEEELKEIENAVSIYDAKIKTGCEPLDVILTEKSLFCNNNGITLTSMADGSGLSFMTASELYSLFGNLLSNAIEAVMQIEEADKRVIDFTVTRTNGMILVRADNYYCGEISFKNGLPQSKKQDKANHGYGVKSMKMLVKKYGGDVGISAENGIFSIKILLPAKNG